MAKIELTDLANLQNETSAVQAINQNNADIEAALENTLSRDGTSPNTMGAVLDMNGYRVINLPAPVDGSDPARLSDITGMLDVGDGVIPSQSGQEDKVLSTDGDSLVWVDQNDESLKITENLADLEDVVAARANLELGTAALLDTGTDGSEGDLIGLLNTPNIWTDPQTFIDGFVTGTSTSTFGGDVILSALVNPVEQSLGYRAAPHTTKDTTWTFNLMNSGRTIKHTSSSPHTWTIPLHSTTAFPNGTTIVLLNMGSGTLTIARTSGVALRIAGNSADQDRTIGQYGLATLYKGDDNSWLISGAGIT